MIFILTLVASVTLIYLYTKWKHTYWKRKHVAGPEPSFLIGNIGSTLSFSEHWGLVTQHWYNKYSNVPYIGFYKMLKPSVLICDVDLVKDILTKDFQSFERNDASLSRKYDPLLSQNPFFVSGEEWKVKRKELLPAFSSSKLRSLMSVTNGVAKEMIDYIRKHKTEDLDAKKVSVRYTTQNVFKCSFSIDARCFDVNEKSEFLKAGEAMFVPSLLVGIKFYMATVLPWMLDYIPTSFVAKETDQLFRALVNDNRESRKTHQSNDIFQLLMQIQEKSDTEPETFLAGHALSLFIDGTETTSTALSYALYELANNPQCQEKLYKEVIEALNKVDKEDDVDINAMPYLEGVLLEGMRIHPPLLVMQKICTKSYELPKTENQSQPITIFPGTPVHIPVQAIHMDAKYYPRPELFRPERFIGEEQQNRHKGTYLGFGEGPRACLGMRFALFQMKIALVHIIKNFYIKLSPNHKPIKIDSQTLLSYPTDGLLLQFERRT